MTAPKDPQASQAPEICDAAARLLDEALTREDQDEKTLLEQFLAEEATAVVRRWIASAVEEAQAQPAMAIRSFELNRFEITLRFDDQSVTVQDVLDASVDGAYELPLAEFLRLLG